MLSHRRKGNTLLQKPNLKGGALKARNLYSALKSSIDLELNTLPMTLQAAKNKRKVNNYRQTPLLDKIIELCESEPLGTKTNKVLLNTYALVHFSSITDDEIEKVFKCDLNELYSLALGYFQADRSEIGQLLSSLRKTRPTTVEFNQYTKHIVDRNIARVNSLPSSVALKKSMVFAGFRTKKARLFSGADVRERALLHFAIKTKEEKLYLIKNIRAEFGDDLTRNTDQVQHDFSRMAFSSKPFTPVNY